MNIQLNKVDQLTLVVFVRFLVCTFSVIRGGGQGVSSSLPGSSYEPYSFASRCKSGLRFASPVEGLQMKE